MIIYGKLKKISKSQLTIDLNNSDVNFLKLDKLKNNGIPNVQIDIEDGRTISPDQRKKIYALMADISEFTGYTRNEVAASTKFEYLVETGKTYFSLSDCSVETANNYLTWILNFCFKNNIPFTTKTWDMIPTDYNLMIQCLRHRRCCICGKHADIDHANTVGMGRNRKKINNRNHWFLPLCREHHQQRHQLGLNSFIQLHHIKPVKLDDDTIRLLKLNTKKQLDQFDEEDKKWNK